MHLFLLIHLFKYKTMSLQTKSQELKDIVATYNADWLLGDISFLINSIGTGRALDQLGKLSSPLRQLYYVAGLNVSSDPAAGIDIQYTPDKWNQIVTLLNEIEAEYQKIFFPAQEEVTDEWKHARNVAMPSFLSYFNQGPLNYEEQVINWIVDLFTPLNDIILAATGISVSDFVLFYENLDKLHQANFEAHSIKKELLRPNWKDYTKIKTGVIDDAPDFIKQMGEENAHLYAFMADHGMMFRFLLEEIVSENLPIEKVNAIVNLLSINRTQTDFLYYTATKPGNPLYEKPILNIGDGMFQIFEVKQVIHAIQNLLEQASSSTEKNKKKYTDRKGNLLELRTIELFSNFFKSDFEFYHGYYVDDCEQDVLFLWKNYAFIIEAKGYALREPLRDPEKAFVRIQKDFKDCIVYGYEQTRRVEKKFIDGVPLRLTDKNGNLIKEIDTTQYVEDFSIIVNLESFGQIQCDLSTLIKLENEDDIYPWAVKLDDLEIFLVTMEALKKKPQDLIDFLVLRESMHGKLISSDELEICGSFLTCKLRQKRIDYSTSIITTPDLGEIFDKQYNKGMGLKNEKMLEEKKSGNYRFW